MIRTLVFYLLNQLKMGVLPHNLTKQQVIDFSPSLADKVARSTATHTVDEISNEIVDLINSHKQ